MTTAHDHTPYLDQLHDDPHAFWESRIRASRWMIIKTFGLGTLAGGFGVLGQIWLEQAAPIFPIISQNYGLWQGGYLLSLILIFVLWAAAMLQKIGFLQDSKQGLRTQHRIDEQNARREARAQAARERREQARRDREENSIFYKTAARSKRFDD